MLLHFFLSPHLLGWICPVVGSFFAFCIIFLTNCPALHETGRQLCQNLFGLTTASSTAHGNIAQSRDLDLKCTVAILFIPDPSSVMAAQFGFEIQYVLHYDN